ncbi:MAG TPA: thioesterase family protein, partial [Mycobacterium sp.]|nr:thioesterase family protein [Mycobacterium sp.]
MTDCYYELLEDDAPVGPARGQRLRPTAMAISTWTSAIQHGAPVSALLVRALER